MTSRTKLYVGIVVAIVTIGSVTAAVYFLLPRHRSQVYTSGTVTYSTDKPSEKKPGKNYEWQGKPDDPKKIIIPNVGIDNFIQNVGIDQNKEVAVPSNIHLAGWFADSVKPGAKGLSVIVGHINGRLSKNAIFSALPKVQKGARLSVEFGNGLVKHFEVFQTQEALANEALQVLFSQDPKVKSQLNLITCVGVFDQKARRYDKRLIVSAKLTN